MTPHDAVAERLARLAPDQRAAAIAPPGPVLCVAPAGSGKTTTLIARVAWLVATGADPAAICVVAFNRRAAAELAARVTDALAPLGIPAGAVRVRTFHALGREVLVDAGVDVARLVDREAVIRTLWPASSARERAGLDLAFSRLKLDLGVAAEHAASDPGAGPIARAFVRYEGHLRAVGVLDFDDLVARALGALERDVPLLDRWRTRCRELLVDEAQDLDRSQLRLALLLAAPANRIFLVGDDDQTIYGWRLADVRRVLGLAGYLPRLRRVDLVTNYRCPSPVVERAVRLVAHNRERFRKRIVARPGASGRLVLAPDPADDVVRIGRMLASWPADGSTRAVLARTNRELVPAVVAALELGVAFRASDLALAIEDERLDDLLAQAAQIEDQSFDGPTQPRAGGPSQPRDGGPPQPPPPAVVTIGRLRARLAGRAWPGRPSRPRSDPVARGGPAAPIGPRLAAVPGDRSPEPDDRTPTRVEDDRPTPDTLAAMLLGWAAGYPDVASFSAAVAERRARLRGLRRDDASLTLATAHGTKGLEWDHVGVLTDGFPSRRSLDEAVEPERALEEERRLAYVAWTRARRSLTLLFDPVAPSPFLLEAFRASELEPDAPP